MKAVIDSFNRVSPIISTIAALFYFGFPLSSWAGQFGATIGNLAVAASGLLLLVVIFLWIDQLMNYSRLSGWRLFFVRNGLRLAILLPISLPLIGVTVKPTILPVYTHAHPYEVGKTLTIDVFLTNKNRTEKLVKGMYIIFPADTTEPASTSAGGSLMGDVRVHRSKQMSECFGTSARPPSSLTGLFAPFGG